MNITNSFRLQWRKFLQNYPTTQPSYLPRKGLWHTIQLYSTYGHGNILDVGCGCKPYRGLFANASKYVGIDTKISGHSYFDENIVDIFYDGRKLPFPDNSFDTVVCFQVLEHVLDIAEILTEIGRVLVPGGVVITTFPFMWPEHEIPFDFRRWTIYGAQQMFEKNGFKIIRTSKIGGFAEVISSLVIDRFGEVTSGFAGFRLVIMSLIINNVCRIYRILNPLKESSGSRRFYLDVALVAMKMEYVNTQVAINAATTSS